MNTKLLSVFCLILFASVAISAPVEESDEKNEQVSNEVDVLHTDVEGENLNPEDLVETHGLFSHKNKHKKHTPEHKHHKTEKSKKKKTHFTTSLANGAKEIAHHIYESESVRDGLKTIGTEIVMPALKKTIEDKLFDGANVYNRNEGEGSQGSESETTQENEAEAEENKVEEIEGNEV